MKKLILVVLAISLLAGCAYTSTTKITAKAKDVKAIVGGTPIAGNGDVLFERICKWTWFAKELDIEEDE